MSSSLYLQLRCETLQSVLPTFMSTLHSSYCNANLNTLAVTLFTNSGHYMVTWGRDFSDFLEQNGLALAIIPSWTGTKNQSDLDL